MRETNDQERTVYAACPPPGSMPWYQALIDRVAASEKQAILQKMAEYGVSAREANDDVFALLHTVGNDTGLPPWQVWQVGATRHWDAIAGFLEQTGHHPDAETCRMLIRRCLDLLGYAYQAIALCDYRMHRED